MVDSGPNALSGVYGSSVRLAAPAITSAASGAADFPGGTAYNPTGYAYTPVNHVFQAPQVSVEAWFKLNSVNSTAHDLPLIVYGTVSRGLRYGLSIHGEGTNDPKLLYQQQNGSQKALYLIGTSSLAPGATYHVVVISDGNKVTIYLNGLLEAAASYAGSIDYSSYFTDGLQIGGANQIPQYASASFNGTIGQAAIYNHALSQAQVVSHFLAGQLIHMYTARVVQSDSFIDSIGVNTHFDNPHSTYALQYPKLKALLVSSGIRHLREAMVFNNQPFINLMKDLGKANIDGSYLTQLGFTKSQIEEFPAMIGPSFEQYEAPNEQDDVGNANWLPECLSFQRNLYSWVKSDPATARFPVLGPALAWMPDIIAAGDLGSYLDYGNIHDYFNVFNPGTTGWGPYYSPYGYYGSVNYNRGLGYITSGKKQLQATESGYGTIPGKPTTLDDRTDLRYMTRLFFTQFNAGIARTYSYELVDEGGSTQYNFNYFGLIQQDLAPKPAFYGIKSIIAALADPGPHFAATPLTFRLSGFIHNVQYSVFQKRSGQYILAVWLEVPGWVTLGNAGGDITVPAQSVTLQTANHFSSATISSMDENGEFSTTPGSWNGTSMPVSVTDKITLITLKP